MRHHFFSLLLGLVLGAAISWLPTVVMGGSGFVLPLILWGPWYLLAIPYAVIFVLVFGILMGIYRLFKKSFPISLVDGAWVLLGLYLSLTFFFHLVGIAATGGNLTL
jgi:hypothetical protein